MKELKQDKLAAAVAGALVEQEAPVSEEEPLPKITDLTLAPGLAWLSQFVQDHVRSLPSTSQDITTERAGEMLDANNAAYKKYVTLCAELRKVRDAQAKEIESLKAQIAEKDAYIGRFAVAEG